ncbi:MAG: hypothetical protein IMHGJWDQ_001657 [Candidatus Fervidibacter sp.]
MTVAGGGNEKEPKTVFDELDMDGVDASGHWQEEQNRLVEAHRARGRKKG